MYKKIFRLFFGNTKKKHVLILDILAGIYLIYFLFIQFASGIFFRNSYKLGNITFKCAGYEKYDNGASEVEFRRACDAVMEAVSQSELYDAGTKISIMFCHDHASYKFLACNPFEDSIGFKRNLSPFNVITVNKTSFTEMTAFGGAKENNARKLSRLLVHEATHAFSKKRGLVGFFTPAWKDEGICEYAAGESSFPVQKGWQHFLADEHVKARSYTYFLYRVAVTYMRDVEGLSFSAIVADKRKQQEVLDSARRHVQESGSYLF
jgi:hypothetical protein